MVSKFKVGDRVKIVGTNWKNTYGCVIPNIPLTNEFYPIRVSREATGDIRIFRENELELLERVVKKTLDKIVNPNEVAEFKSVGLEPDDVVGHPSHYTSGKIEVWDFIVDQGLNYCRGNVVKYVVRAGWKDSTTELQDLKKARAYIDREIKRVEHA